jgi:O-antigen ligase
LLGAARIAGTRLVVGLGLVFVIAIFVSGYAAAILAFCAGTASLIGGRYLPRVTAISLVAALAAMAFVVPATLPSAQLSPLLRALPASSPQHRILIADFVSERIAERPYLGWGLDTSRAIPGGSAKIMETPSRAERFDPDLLAPGVRDIGQNLPLHPHSVALQVRLELGGIGAALWLVCVGVLLVRVLRVREPWERAVALGQIAAILAIWSVSFGAWQTWWLAAIVLSILATRAAYGMRPRSADDEIR